MNALSYLRAVQMLAIRTKRLAPGHACGAEDGVRALGNPMPARQMYCSNIVYGERHANGSVARIH